MTEPTRNPPRVKPWWQSPWLLTFVVAAALITLLRPYCKKRTSHIPDPPPKLGLVPEFRFVDQHGKPYGTQELRGKVWVGNFFFTSCRSICPRLTAQMQTLEKRFRAAGLPVNIVSISVDPEMDTPDVLLAYAKKNNIDLSLWTFLTAKEAQIRSLMEEGLKLNKGTKEKVDGIVDIAHTGRVILVDGSGNLRGRYPSDDEGIDEIFHRSKHVLDEAKKSP